MVGNYWRSGSGGSGKEVVIQTGGYVGRWGNDISLRWDGGDIICNDKDVSWQVAKSNSVAQLRQWELCWWCVRSCRNIQMGHPSMRNGSKVADELYIKRGCLGLEDFLFFCLYSFSCIAKQFTTLNQLQLLSWLDSLNTNFEPLLLIPAITLLWPISPTPDPTIYIEGPQWLQALHGEDNCTGGTGVNIAAPNS